MKSLVRGTLAACCLTLAAMLSGCGGTSQPAAPLLTITTAALQGGVSGTAYSQSIQASGGVAPFNWTVSAGTLPHNLAVSPSTSNSAVISGTPDTAVQAGTFTIQVTDASHQSASQSYTVSILLTASSITFSPASVDFPAQVMGTSSGQQAETLTNTSSSPLAISSIALAGSNGSDFVQTSACGSSLAGGASCSIGVVFTPGQVGPRSASITITDDTDGSPQSFALNGVGVNAGANATLSASNLTFGGEMEGTASTAQSVTLTNYGDTTLILSSIVASANFAETDNCFPRLASAASCAINVTFTPSSTGNVSGTLSVTSNAPGSPETISLSGTGSVGMCSTAGQGCSASKLCCAGLRCGAVAGVGNLCGH